MPEPDHRAAVLALYRERFGQKAEIPDDVWHRAPQIMRDRGWSAEQALDFLMNGGDWRSVTTSGFPGSQRK